MNIPKNTRMESLEKLSEYKKDESNHIERVRVKKETSMLG